MAEIITFLPNEEALLKQCDATLKRNHAPLLATIHQRVDEIYRLAQIANGAPSLSGEGRTWETLARKLRHQGISEVINQPLKSVVGRAFLVGKLHLFGFLAKLATTEATLAPLAVQIEDIRHDILFLLMAEDLYSAAIADSSGAEPWLDAASYELIQMWETRTNCATPEFASDLRRLWDVRQTIAPAFGTLHGTIEMMRHLLGLSGAWHEFVEVMAGDAAITHALEEYLFSLSHEQINRLRQQMHERAIPSIGRVEVGQWLGLDIPAANGNGSDAPALHLYRSFLRRQSQARVRKWSHIPGPTRTLEEHFVVFLLTRQYAAAT